MHDVLDLRDLVADELAQRRETGYEEPSRFGEILARPSEPSSTPLVAAGLLWGTPLGDLVHSAIFGFDNSRISDLAERTLRLALRSPARAHG